MKITKMIGRMAAIVACAALASCNTDGSDEFTTTQTLPQYYNIITGKGMETTYVQTGTAYTLLWNLTSHTADLGIEGLVLPDGTRYTSLTFDKLPWTMDAAGWKVISVNGAKPSSSVVAPTFDNFRFALLDRFVTVNNTPGYAPCVNISYQIGDYTIKSMPSRLVNYGKTVVSTSGSEPYTPSEQETPVYLIDVNADKGTADITILGAKFAAQMPGMNMRFKNVPVAFSGAGKIYMACDALTPVIVGSDNKETPYESFPITNLHGESDAANNMDLMFTCTMKREVNGQQMQVAYNVTVTCTTPTNIQ